MEKTVIVYTQEGCGPCHAEVEFLKKHNVDFDERDIRRNPEYVQELQEIGSYATPTTVIDDQVIIGFDQDKIRRLLNI